MLKSIKLQVISPLMLGLMLVLVSCRSQTTQYYSCEGKTQGTMYHITYEYNTDIHTEIDSILVAFSASLSNYNPQSVVSKFNNNDSGFVADTMLIRMINLSREVWNKTGGMFDITIAPVANLWGFGWEKVSAPDTTKLPEAMSNMGMDKIVINGNKVTKTDPNVTIITNGIAQGLSVDCMAEFFEKKGIRNYLIEIGGEIVAGGAKKNGEMWRIGIDEPIQGSDYSNRVTQTVINLNGKAVSTSGNYRKFVEMNGSQLGHSLNPKTGYPATTDMLSATVIADNCALADAYATAFMVMGFEKSMALADKLTGIEVYFIYLGSDNSHKVAYSKGFTNYFAE